MFGYNLARTKVIFQQEAQTDCKIFHHWGAQKIARTSIKSVLKNKMMFDKIASTEIFPEELKTVIFIKFWIWRLANIESRMEKFAFLAHEVSKLMNKIGHCST